MWIQVGVRWGEAGGQGDVGPGPWAGREVLAEKGRAARSTAWYTSIHQPAAAGTPSQRGWGPGMAPLTRQTVQPSP